MPFRYECVECDAVMYIETEPLSYICDKCKAMAVQTMAGVDWTDADEATPRTKFIHKVRMEDGFEGFAIWMPDLNGWALDLPTDFDHERDPVPEHGKVKQWRRIT
jgi:hypothetical protein